MNRLYPKLERRIGPRGAGLLLVLPAFLLALSGGFDDDSSPEPEEPPFQISDFETAESCPACHPNYYTEWASSMHAYSFTDPLFFTFNFAEQESTGGALGQWCNSCHSPVGRLTGTTSCRRMMAPNRVL